MILSFSIDPNKKKELFTCMGTNVPIIRFFLLFTTKNHSILWYKFSKNFYILRDLLEVFGKKSVSIYRTICGRCLQITALYAQFRPGSKRNDWVFKWYCYFSINWPETLEVFHFFLIRKKSYEINSYFEIMLTLKKNVQLLKHVLLSLKN